MYAIRSYYVTTEIPENKDLIEDKKNGILFPVNNSDSVITSYSIHYTKLYDINLKKIIKYGESIHKE